MAETTLQRVQRVVAEELGCKEDEVVPNASPTEDLGADSLDVVGLIMAIEDEFNIDIADDDVANGKLNTIGEIVLYVDAKLV